MKRFTQIFSAMLLASSLVACGEIERSVYLIPSGSSGWFTVVYEQADWPSIEDEEVSELYDFGTSKIIITSSEQIEGTRRSEYYFVDDSGNRSRIYTSPLGGGGKVWGRRMSSLREKGYPDLSLFFFFIGDEVVYKSTGEKELDSKIELVRAMLKENKPGDFSIPPLNADAAKTETE